MENNLNFKKLIFSERLLMASEHIIQEYRAKYSSESGVSFSTESLTELLYKTDIREIRKDVVEYLKLKKSAVILFDNLDRGWPESGLTNDDILVIRCLIDASRKIQRELRQKDIDFSSIVFLRNDVFQILMRRTADFGKDLTAQLDWTDPDQIKELIRLRMTMSEADKEQSFDTLWSRYFVRYVDGIDSSDYILERSLRRPRNVIKMIYEARSSAINLGHKIIDDTDVKKGVERFSRNLLIEADRELTDIHRYAEGILYNLIGEKSVLTRERIYEVIFVDKYKDLDKETVIDRLLYFGFLGIFRNGKSKYIYDVGYDMSLLKAEIAKFSDEIRFEINPAFYAVLYITEE
ncbi:P-loop ATPase, Sll1717 family [Brevundimonas vesicularis]|uniref:P-loop ATPase, Sll1717 family n=1 Tax=Brevundimonas vesicularis TaxID=41276 RepID=UPI0038D4D287